MVFNNKTEQGNIQENIQTYRQKPKPKNKKYRRSCFRVDHFIKTFHIETSIRLPLRSERFFNVRSF